MNESLARRPPLLVEEAKEAADADAKDLRIDIMNLRPFVYHGGRGAFFSFPG